MHPYSNSRRHHLRCRYGCCMSRKDRYKCRCLKKGARQLGLKEKRLILTYDAANLYEFFGDITGLVDDRHFSDSPKIMNHSEGQCPYHNNNEDCPVCDDPKCEICGNPGWACDCYDGECA